MDQTEVKFCFLLDCFQNGFIISKFFHTLLGKLCHTAAQTNFTMQALLLPSSVFSCFTAPEKLQISSSVPGSCFTFTWSDLKLTLLFSAVLPEEPQLERYQRINKSNQSYEVWLFAECTLERLQDSRES